MRANMPNGPDERLSWWCALSREEFTREVAMREPLWRAQRGKGFLDFIGTQIIGWREPRLRARSSAEW